VTEDSAEVIPAQRVRAGWMRSALVPLIGAVIIIGVLSTLLRAATTHSSPSLVASEWPLIVGVASVVAVASLTVFFSLVREVELSPTNIDFRVGFRTIRVAWVNLVPPRAPFFIGITFWYRRAGVVQESDGLVLTRRLARAILEHPSCPRFEMAGRIWSSLGLQARIPTS